MFTGSGEVTVTGGEIGVLGVGSTDVGLGALRPGAFGRATGGSKVPNKSDAHVAQAGSRAVTSGGRDSCGVQVKATVVPRSGSVEQLAVQEHLPLQFVSTGCQIKNRASLRVEISEVDCRPVSEVWGYGGKTGLEKEARGAQFFWIESQSYERECLSDLTTII